MSQTQPRALGRSLVPQVKLHSLSIRPSSRAWQGWELVMNFGLRIFSSSMKASKAFFGALVALPWYPGYGLGQQRLRPILQL